jgi:hypothetical protein
MYSFYLLENYNYRYGYTELKPQKTPTSERFGKFIQRTNHDTTTSNRTTQNRNVRLKTIQRNRKRNRSSQYGNKIVFDNKS